MAKTVNLAAVLMGGLFAAIVTAPAVLQAQGREQRIIESSTGVLDEMMASPVQAIPRSLLADAQAVAVIPGVIKGGFVVGARHGKGVLLMRTERGDWRLPMFISLTGGNIGWQAGVQSTDLILVFKTQRSIEGILRGKLTLGADAAVAAGPVGRKAAAATDERLRAEIYSYSRSRGLFAGVSVDGSVLRVEPALNAAYYKNQGPAGDSAAPESALRLIAKVAGYIETTKAAKGSPLPVETVRPAPVGKADVVRRQLAAAATQLSPLLDPQWREYLSIPAEVFQAGAHPSLDAVRRSVARHQTVAEDPRYAALAKRAEFQRTFQLLREYERILTPRSAALPLPPPPVANQVERVLPD